MMVIWKRSLNRFVAIFHSNLIIYCEFNISIEMFVCTHWFGRLRLSMSNSIRKEQYSYWGFKIVDILLVKIIADVFWVLFRKFCAFFFSYCFSMFCPKTNFNWMCQIHESYVKLPFLYNNFLWFVNFVCETDIKAVDICFNLYE